MKKVLFLSHLFVGFFSMIQISSASAFDEKEDFISANENGSIIDFFKLAKKFGTNNITRQNDNNSFIQAESIETVNMSEYDKAQYYLYHNPTKLSLELWKSKKHKAK